MNIILLKTKASFLYAGCIVVLLQFFFCGLTVRAQTTDSLKLIVFNPSLNSAEQRPIESRLGGIASLNVGTYSGFHDQGHYASFIQPNIGFEFLAEPGGFLHLLLGARIGFLNVITTGISFGIREQIYSAKPDLKLFSDLGILFFNDAESFGQPKYGVRLAFGARTSGSINLEYRFAGEWRGIASDSVDGYKNRLLWWIGAEVGIAFSLVGESKPITRKDSLHASLRYIASGDELDELDQISSNTKLDQWLDRFWRIRDISPDTKINEARIEFEKRVERANGLFSTPKQLGVLTDPGRAMVIYGIPDIEDEDVSVIDNRVRYKLFVYNGRVRDVSFAAFLFRTPSSQTNWQQVYSSVPGEISGGYPNGLPPRMGKWIGL